MKAEVQEVPGTEVEVELAAIAFDPDQPRTAADETALDQLVRSIRAHGIQQPVILTLQPDPEIAAHKPYLLLHGSRRCTAALRAGLSRVRAVLRHEELSADDRLMRQLAENDEREDLNVYDRATAVARAFEASGLNQAEFARKHGKSRPWVASQLWLARVEGLTAAALRERLIRHGETARLFAQLPPRTQQRLVETARAAGEPITIAIVKRLLPKPKEDADEGSAPDRARREASVAEDDETSRRDAAASPPSLAGDPSDRIPIYLRAESVPTLLGHFGIRRADAGDSLGPSEEAADLLAAYLESLVRSPHAAVPTSSHLIS
jgi:ParB family chromosome partitioning protein